MYGAQWQHVCAIQDVLRLQALSGLNTDTPYFLLLRNDNRSSESTDSVSSVEDLLGLLAYTVVLPPPDSFIAAVLSSLLMRRRLDPTKGPHGASACFARNADLPLSGRHRMVPIRMCRCTPLMTLRSLL